MTSRLVAAVVDAGVVGATKLGIGLMLWSAGVTAVSDDDFSRVVIAQRWVLDPGLDPSGTSWLPLPFWWNGLAMMLGGRSLDTARGLALGLGVLSAMLVYAAARLLSAERRAAYLGALLAAALPSTAVLGIATVPELPTAALVVFAIACASRCSGRLRLLGAGALLCASLSRYEPWFVAFGFAVLTLRDARREELAPVGRARGHGVAAAALALAGPAGWIIHNAIAYGDPLRFLARVSSYRRALAGAGDASWSGAWSDVLAYPIALVRQEPELALATAALISLRLVDRHRGRRRIDAPLPEAARRAVLLAGCLVGGLIVAAFVGGVPTHHVGRPLVAVWLLGALFVGAELHRVLGRVRRRTAAIAGGVGLVALALAALWLRPRIVPAASSVDRAEQIAIGRAVGQLVPADADVLLHASDFGYFAVLAASGRPEAFVVDRPIDPRLEAQPSSFASVELLRQRLRETGARFVVADRTRSATVPFRALREAGRWALFAVPDGFLQSSSRTPPE